MMKIGYARISTKAQLKGTSLDDQEEQLKAAGADKVIREQYTGTTKERPQLQKALSELNSGDTFMVTKLDRFARNAQDAVTLINDLHDKNITVHILNMGIADNSTMGKLMINILAAFAEFERDSTVERMQTGREYARHNPGYRDGRKPKYSQARLDAALRMLDEGKTYKQAEIDSGISKSTLIRARKAQRMKTA